SRIVHHYRVANLCLGGSTDEFEPSHGDAFATVRPHGRWVIDWIPVLGELQFKAKRHGAFAKTAFELVVQVVMRLLRQLLGRLARDTGFRLPVVAAPATDACGI